MVSTPRVGLAQPGSAEFKATLELKDSEGRRQNLARYQGRIVILSFVAPWCEYCREKMPFLDSLGPRYPKGQVQVIGVKIDAPHYSGPPHSYRQILTIHFPLWVGATLDDLHRLGFPDALPAMAIIDRDGRLVSRIVGAFDNADLTRQIEWLLSSRTGPSPLTLAAKTDQHEPIVAGKSQVRDVSPSEDLHSETVVDAEPHNPGPAGKSQTLDVTPVENLHSETTVKESSVVPSCALCPSPTVSGVVRREEERWSTSLRIVPGLTHSSVRMTLGYQFHPRLSGGLAFYPVHHNTGTVGTTSVGHAHGAVQPIDTTGQVTSTSSGHTPVRPYLDWVAITETGSRPALILGTSSDRIDLPYGQAYFATVSKNLSGEMHLPISPYVGASYGTYDHKLRPIGGLNTNITRHISSLIIFDGVHVHPVVNVRIGQFGFSFMLINCRKPGGSVSMIL